MKTIYLMIIVLLLAGCATKDDSDAWGNFEADETVLSARITGNIQELLLKEGEQILAGDLIAVIDTTDLALSRAELQNHLRLLSLKKRAAQEKYQLGQTELANLQSEQARWHKLLAQNASTQKQVDDLDANLRVKEQSLQMNRTEIQMADTELAIALNKLDSINANLAKCYLRAPHDATVLSIYTQQGEFTAVGKALVKLADLQNMKAVFYLSGPQLSTIKLAQNVTVRIDGAQALKSYPAQISYISDKAEFTPKVIQTREERTTLVYRVEAICPNDGSLKQGMPLEIRF